MRIAIDFDGTIVEHAYPKIGKPIPNAIEVIKQLSDKGHQLILWTYRSGDLLNEAVDYCKANGIEFYAINQDHPNKTADYKEPRLITADCFIDDRNVGGLMDWLSVKKTLIDVS